MPSFSQRHGLEPSEKPVQDTGLDTRTRNRLWNYCSRVVREWVDNTPSKCLFARLYYDEFLGAKHSDLPDYRSHFTNRVEKDFSVLPYNKVYEILEFIAKFLYALDERIREANRYSETKQTAADFTKKCNLILEAELSAFRFIGIELAKLTDKHELEEVQHAATASGVPEGTRTHIKQATRHYSNRDVPDFRNSVKESISAVEATAKWLAEDPSASCGTALTKIEQSYGLHGALKSGFSSLYGWTSQDGGARHALMDRETITEADARYMLVSCSAFCNYLVSLKAHGPRAEA